MHRTATALGLATLTAVASLLFAPAVMAQEEDTDISSVTVRPADPDRLAPNAGSWFVYEIEAGGSARGRAEVYNPADVAQKVLFGIQDVIFNENGTPEIPEGEQVDVGAWGRLDVDEAVIPAKATLSVEFTLEVPDDAEPGDHIGVFIATTVNDQGSFAVERRIARRLYVTVPGDVTPAWEIESVDLDEVTSLFPSEASLVVQLRNTGRVRVEPTVTAGDVTLDGSPILVAKSVEQYTAILHVPWWGGPVSTTVEVITADGSVRTATASIFVIPIGPIIVLLLVSVIAFGIWRWRKNRVSKADSIKQDIERLERLVREQQGAGVAGGVVPAPATPLATGPAVAAEPDPSGEAVDRSAALLQAAKRARRSQDDAGLAGVAMRLHQNGRNALDLLLEAAGRFPGEADDLLTAAASYGSTALAHPSLDKLRPEQKTLLERKVAEQMLGMNSSTASATVGAATPAVADDIDLSKVPGLGEAKQQALLEHFGSVEAVAQASPDELAAVKGIGPSLASKLAQHLGAKRRG